MVETPENWMDAKKAKALQLLLLKFGIGFAVLVILGVFLLIADMIYSTSGGGTP